MVHLTRYTVHHARSQHQVRPGGYRKWYTSPRTRYTTLGASTRYVLAGTGNGTPHPVHGTPRSEPAPGTSWRVQEMVHLTPYTVHHARSQHQVRPGGYRKWYTSPGTRYTTLGASTRYVLAGTGNGTPHPVHGTPRSEPAPGTSWRVQEMVHLTRYTVHHARSQHQVRPGGYRKWYTSPGTRYTTLGASTRYVLAGTGNGTPHPVHGTPRSEPAPGTSWRVQEMVHLTRYTVHHARSQHQVRPGGYRKWYTSPRTRYTTLGASTRYVLAGTGNGTPHPVHGTPRSEPAPGTSWRVQEMVHLTRYTVHHARSQHQVRPGGYRKWYTSPRTRYTTLGASTRYVLAGTGNGTPHPVHGTPRSEPAPGTSWRVQEMVHLTRYTVHHARSQHQVRPGGYRKWYTSPGTRYTTLGASTRYVLAGTGNGTPHPVHGTPRSEPAPGTSWRVQEMVHLTPYTVHHARSQHQVRPGGYRKWYTSPGTTVHHARSQHQVRPGGYRKWYTSPGTRYTTLGASTRYVLAGTGNGTPHPVHGTPRSEPAPGTSWRVQEMVHLTRYTVHHARSQHQVRPGGYRKWYTSPGTRYTTLGASTRYVLAGTGNGTPHPVHGTPRSEPAPGTSWRVQEMVHLTRYTGTPRSEPAPGTYVRSGEIRKWYIILLEITNCYMFLSICQ